MLQICLFLLVLTLTNSSRIFISFPSCSRDPYFYINYDPAKYGPQITNTQFNIVIPSSTYMCSTSDTFKKNNNSKIAVLAARGNCNFQQKTLNAQRNGANFLIVYDVNEEYHSIYMTSSGTFPSSSFTIPSVMISLKNAQKLINMSKQCKIIKGQITDAASPYIATNISTIMLPQVVFNINYKASLAYLRQVYQNHMFDLFFHSMRIPQHVLVYTHWNCQNKTCDQESDCLFTSNKLSNINKYCYQSGFHKGKSIMIEQVRSFSILTALGQSIWWKYAQLFTDNRCYDRINLEECVNDTLQELNVSVSDKQKISKQMLSMQDYQNLQQYQVYAIMILVNQDKTLDYASKVYTTWVKICKEMATWIPQQQCQDLKNQPIPLSLTSLDPLLYTFIDPTLKNYTLINNSLPTIQKIVMVEIQKNILIKLDSLLIVLEWQTVGPWDNYKSYTAMANSEVSLAGAFGSVQNLTSRLYQFQANRIGNKLVINLMKKELLSDKLTLKINLTVHSQYLLKIIPKITIPYVYPDRVDLTLMEGKDQTLWLKFGLVQSMKYDYQLTVMKTNYLSLSIYGNQKLEGQNYLSLWTPINLQSVETCYSISKEGLIGIYQKLGGKLPTANIYFELGLYLRVSYKQEYDENPALISVKIAKVSEQLIINPTQVGEFTFQMTHLFIQQISISNFGPTSPNQPLQFQLTTNLPSTTLTHSYRLCLDDKFCNIKFINQQEQTVQWWTNFNNIKTEELHSQILNGQQGRNCLVSKVGLNYPSNQYESYMKIKNGSLFIIYNIPNNTQRVTIKGKLTTVTTYSSSILTLLENQMQPGHKSQRFRVNHDSNSYKKYYIYLVDKNNDKSVRVYFKAYAANDSLQIMFNKHSNIPPTNHSLDCNYYQLSIPSQISQSIFIDVYVQDKLRNKTKTEMEYYSIGYSSQETAQMKANLLRSGDQVITYSVPVTNSTFVNDEVFAVYSSQNVIILIEVQGASLEEFYLCMYSDLTQRLADNCIKEFKEYEVQHNSVKSIKKGVQIKNKNKILFNLFNKGKQPKQYRLTIYNTNTSVSANAKVQQNHKQTKQQPQTQINKTKIETTQVKQTEKAQAKQTKTIQIEQQEQTKTNEHEQTVIVEAEQTQTDKNKQPIHNQQKIKQINNQQQVQIKQIAQNYTKDIAIEPNNNKQSVESAAKQSKLDHSSDQSFINDKGHIQQQLNSQSTIQNITKNKQSNIGNDKLQKFTSGSGKSLTQQESYAIYNLIVVVLIVIILLLVLILLVLFKLNKSILQLGEQVNPSVGQIASDSQIQSNKSQNQ